MSRKLNIKIGFFLIPFAFIFLFEPFFKLSDLLPDFLGYLVLYCGLVSLADVNHRVRKALGGFKLAILISILRFVAKYILNSLFSDTEYSVGLLLFVFILSFFELILVIPAYKNLFEGLLSLGLMHDGESVYRKRSTKKLKIDPDTGEKTLIIRESGKNATEKIYFLTVCFYIIKALGVTLPEVTSLATNQDYEFIHIVRLIGFFAVLLFGTFWLVSIIKYFVSVIKDKTFTKNLTDLHREVLLLNPNIYDARILSTGFYIMISAFVLSIDLYSDHVNVIHNGLFYVIMIFAAIVLSKFSKKWSILLGLSGGGMIISYLTHHFNETLYSDPNFYAGAAKKDIDAYYGFYRMAFFSLADAIWMLLTVIIALIFILDIYRKYTAYPLCPNKAEKKEYLSGFWSCAIPAISLATLSSAAYVYFIFTQPLENAGLWYFSYASLINVGISIAFAISAITTAFFAKSRVETRYSLDL